MSRRITNYRRIFCFARTTGMYIMCTCLQLIWHWASQMVWSVVRHYFIIIIQALMLVISKQSVIYFDRKLYLHVRLCVCCNLIYFLKRHIQGVFCDARAWRPSLKCVSPPLRFYKVFRFQTRKIKTKSMCFLNQMSKIMIIIIGSHLSGSTCFYSLPGADM